MANFYVDPVNGDAENDGLAMVTAKKTIADAISLLAAHGDAESTIHLAQGDYDSANQGGAGWMIDLTAVNDKGVTIKRYDSHTDEVSCSLDSATSCIGIDTNGAVTFEDIVFVQTGSADQLILPESNRTGDLSFTRCAFTVINGAYLFNQVGTDATGDCTFTDCTLNGVSIKSDRGIRLNSCGDFTWTGGSITASHGSGGLFSFYYGTFGSITIENVDVDVSGVFFTISDVVVSVGTVNVSWNRVEDCLRFTYVNEVELTNPVFNYNIVDRTTAGSDSILCVGRDQDVVRDKTIKGAQVIGNYIHSPSNQTGHCVLIGSNVGVRGVGGDAGATISHNILNNEAVSDYGLVVKGANCSVYANAIRAGRCIHLCGGANNSIHHNSCYSIGAYALSWIQNQYTLENPTSNEITHNIFDSSAGLYYAMCDQTGGHFDNLIDWNCLVPTQSGDVAYLDDAEYNTLEAIRAKWAAWSDTHPDNDSHSILVADPLFKDVTAGALDLRVDRLSPCVDAGDLAYVREVGETDLAGNERIVGVVDIGAYEYGISGSRPTDSRPHHQRLMYRRPVFRRLGCL